MPVTGGLIPLFLELICLPQRVRVHVLLIFAGRGIDQGVLTVASENKESPQVATKVVRLSLDCRFGGQLQQVVRAPFTLEALALDQGCRRVSSGHLKQDLFIRCELGVGLHLDAKREVHTCPALEVKLAERSIEGGASLESPRGEPARHR